MVSCWKLSPKERPTFTELKISLENLLENVGDYLHLDFDETDVMTQKTIASCERYLRPINFIR